MAGKRRPAADSVEAWAAREGVHPGAAAGLHSKLSRVFNRPYILAEPATNGMGEIIKSLENGQHVILSFGKNESDLDYLLVTNLLNAVVGLVAGAVVLAGWTLVGRLRGKAAANGTH